MDTGVGEVKEHLAVKATLKDSSLPCEKVLSVTVSEDLIRQEYDGFFQEIGKHARVPGFRPGKVPREVLETQFRKEAKEKVLEKLISRSLEEAIREKQLEFLGRPAIRGIEFTDENLRYEVLLEIPPAFRQLKYKGLSAKKREVDVKPETVDETLRQVQANLAKFAAVEDRPAEMGDFVIADYTCTVEGREAEKRSDDWIELREGEFLKGFSRQLVGSRAGEEREVRISFPENFSRKEWAGKEGVFQVRVKEVKAKKLPPLTDELAKETGEFETLEQMRHHLQQKIEAEERRKVEVEYEEALLDALLKENSFEVPKGVVERRVVSLGESLVAHSQRRGMVAEVADKDFQSLCEKLRPEAQRQVKISFLLDAIVKKEGLQLSEADFEAKYKEASERHRQRPEAVQKYYSEHPEAKESLGIQILNEKVIQLIKDNAKLEE